MPPPDRSAIHRRSPHLDAQADAQPRIGDGEQLPEDIKRILGDLVVGSAASAGVVDIYAKAGLPQPRLDNLTPEWVEEAQKPRREPFGYRADVCQSCNL